MPRRARHPMPPDIEAPLRSRVLRAACEGRPPYQRDDWLIWIDDAKRPDTSTPRHAGMLAELAAGEGYMGMPRKPRGKVGGEGRCGQ